MDPDDLFLNEIEKELSVNIPIQIKNLLKICGMTNHLSLIDISENDFKSIEEFAQTDLKDIIKEEQFEEYYGIYKSNPNKFKLLIGQKKLISKISDHLKEKQKFQREFCPSEERNPKKLKKCHARQTTSTDSKNIEENIENVTCVSQNLPSESNNISRLINSWLKVHVKPLDKKTGDEIIKRMQHMEFVCTVHNDYLTSAIPCFFCSNKIKVQKICRPNGSSRWILTNFYRHFTNHLEDKNQNINSLPNAKDKKKGQTSILQFCENKNQNKNIDHTELLNASYKEPVFTDEPSTSGSINKFSQNKIVIYTSGSEDEDSKSENDEISDEIGETRKILLPQEIKQSHGKWKQEKYSRIARGRRARQKICEESAKQPLITNYFKPVDDITKLINENENLKTLLIAQSAVLNIKTEGVDNTPINTLMQHFLSTAVKNKNKVNFSGHDNRFSLEIKQFCIYLFVVGGRLLYETLHSNLKNVIPSISTISRVIDQTGQHIAEGILRIDQLKIFLEKRNLPNVVWVSEDATSITGRIQYCTKTNKIVGFVSPFNENGMPQENIFLATSARKIHSYFVNESRANYAYVIMAQSPVDKSPSFCLCIYGTDNRFTSLDVQRRWNYIKSEMKNHGIEILGFSSDGDTRLLKTMRLNSNFQLDKNNMWQWYHMDIKNGDICVQDTVHICTKLRTRLLKPGIILPMGNFLVSVEHIEYIILNFSKDKHLLTISDLQPDDKMNYRAAEKLSSQKVCDILKQNVPNSAATETYLKLLQYVIKSFLDKDVILAERIYSMWYCVFFLRMWRSWIKNTEGYSVNNNFITLNCYICVELNAHAIIKLSQKFRDDNNLSKVQFTPWLFSSQPCEQIFRATRSLTSTFSTIVNFSMQDIMNRINKIQNIHQITSDLSGKFSFPREEKITKLGKTATVEYRQENYFMNDEEIEATVMRALREAKQDCDCLGITYNEDSWSKLSIFDTKQDAANEKCDKENNDMISHNFSLINDAVIQLDYSSEEINNDSDVSEIPEDIPSNMNLLDSNFGDYIDMKEYPEMEIDETSPFVNIKIGETIKTIRKSSLCWLLNQEASRLSSDRLLRVRADATRSILKKYEACNIVLEKYYAVFYSDNWYIGRVLDKLDGEAYKVKFLRESLEIFIWPKKDDIQIVEPQYIFFGPINMLGTGSMKISENVRAIIKKKFKEMKRKEEKEDNQD